ncbi:MAG: hypothetical protein SOX25_05915 [Eubacteriales bacterium]|nr:hypothetical protein [Eubacteriales bacterium]
MKISVQELQELAKFYVQLHATNEDSPTKLLSIYNDAMKELEEANEKNAEERRSLIGHC